jgi:Glu-tRNA(Gln) amidotransferase subunit E-like FAD-binding protein
LTTLYSEAAMVGKTKRNGESTNEEVLAVTRKFKVGVEEIIKIKGSNEFLDFEISLYNKYLPELLTDVELTEIINTLISELPEKSPKAMGVIMGKLKSEYLGRYDGTIASKLVKDLLA